AYSNPLFQSLAPAFDIINLISSICPPPHALRNPPLQYFAPFDIINLTISICPLLHAHCNPPSQSVDPLDIINLTSSIFPPSHAPCNPQIQSYSPLSIKFSTSSLSPFLHALYNWLSILFLYYFLLLCAYIFIFQFSNLDYQSRLSI